MTLFNKLIDDEHGFIITTELVIVATLLVIGLITGIQCLQTAVVSELKDVGAAIGSLNQSYYFTGKHGCWAWGCGSSSYTRGSAFFDQVDEYRQDYEIGCFDVQAGTVTRPQRSETFLVPETGCPPDAVTVPDHLSPGPTIAPESCPPDQSGPELPGYQDCPNGRNCPEADCTDCESGGPH